MSKITISPERVEIDAEIVAKALQLDPHDLRARMQDGTVTSRFERGEGADAGRVRLTFYSDTRRARIIAENSGAIVTCSAVDYTRRAKTGAQRPKARRGKPDLDAMLDAALRGSFPASDPFSLSFERRDESGPDMESNVDEP